MRNFRFAISWCTLLQPARLILAANDNKKMKRTTTKLAFGSCHKNKRSRVPPIWDAIGKEQADAWVWLGDAIYPSSRDENGKKRYGPAPPQELQEAYDEMKHNATIGYSDFLQKTPNVYGVWDDHDYGGNDMGVHMPLKKERQRVFLDFLGYQTHDHDGMYHSVDMNNQNGKVRLVFLDTRWFRQDHCIPSVANKGPLGNAIACVTRWLTSGLFLHQIAGLWGMKNCQNNELLGEVQWKWLEETLLNSKADVNIIVSSIQVWTTNPAMETWGHFPKEQERLWDLLQRHYSKSNSPIIFLSGDVHHSEVSGKFGYLEITSSGLTHHCGEPKLYGWMCQPLLRNFQRHRYEPGAFHIGLNYGVMYIDWQARTILVQIKNEEGDTVLQVEHPLDYSPSQELVLLYKDLPHTWDGHLIPVLRVLIIAFLVAIGIARRMSRMQRPRTALRRHQITTQRR